MFNKTVSFLMIWMCLFLSLSAQTYAKDMGMVRILVLNSYHKGSHWVDGIVEAVESGLKVEKFNYDLRVEYMDTKATKYNTALTAKLYELYLLKYDNYKFDAIVASDDHAFDFLREYHKELFPDTPIIFCAVNNSNAANLIDKNYFTGVMETPDQESMINLAVKLHPGIKKIYLIADTTPSGNFFWEKQTVPLISVYPDIEFIRIDDSVSFSEIEDKMTNLPDDSITFYAIFTRDKTGRYFPLKETVSRISKVSRRPIYTFLSQDLKYGFIGGNVLDGYYQGKKAIDMVIRILQGENIADIPIEKNPTSQFMFNYPELIRYDIKLSDLPKKSIILNKPFSFLKEYKRYVWAVGVAFLILIILIFYVHLLKRRKLEETVPILDEEGTYNSAIEGIIDITKRKKIELTLKQSQQRFELAMDASQDGIYDWNLETNEIYYSPGWKSMLGYQNHELPNDFSIWETLTEPEDVKRSWEMQQELISKKRDRFEMEFKMKHKDGYWIDILSRAKAIFDKGDTAIRIVGTHTDISDRKTSERELKKQRDLFELVINSVPARIFWKDLNLIYLGCNNNFAKDSGMKKPENVIGNDDYGLVWKKDADEYRADDKLVINTGKPKLNYEEEFLNSEGKRVRWLTSKMPLRSSDGKIIGIIATSENVTEQKKAEEALRTSHQRFITVLDGIDATVYVADMQTYKILFMNKFMKDTFGKDMIGELCWNVFRGESGPCKHCKNSSLVDKNGMPTGVKVWQDENPITRKYYINYDRAIEWTDGRLVKLQIATDITDYKRLEKELRQAQKMESIGTLAGGIAHDFNNILSSVIGFAELALGGAEKGTELEDDLQEIRTAGMRAKDLVKQILTFARQSDDAVKPIQVNVITKEVLKFIKSSIPSTIQINDKIISDSFIMGSPTQLHQVLMNLCTNAAQAMEKKGGILEVSVNDTKIDKMAIPDLNPGEYIEIKVTDTGMGISPQDIHTIFEPYFTTKAVGEGTGMGLAVVHGIVENYGGQIKVDSTISKGTCFTIYLPITKKRKVHTHFDKEYLPLGTENILFVDDEAPIAKMGSKVLEQLGYTVTTRTSSVEALELFRSRPQAFDIVVTDMTMPNITGDKLAGELMKIRSDIPVVLCTGYSKKITEESAAEIGIKALAYKPIVKADLAKTVRKVLDEANISS